MTTENNEQPKAPEDKDVKNVVTRDKSKKKLVICAVIGILVALAPAIIIGVSVLGDNDKKVQHRLDVGEKYLEEMDYEQALVAFNTVLKIEPQNVDAYLGIVEVCIRTNEFDKALAYAEEGYEETGDELLKEKIDMIENGDIFASNGWNMKMSGYDEEGNLVFWHEYTYNRKGQEATVSKYNAQGVREQYLKLDYDEEGRPLTGYEYGISSGDLSKITYEYGSDGKCSRKTYYEGLSDVVRSYEEYEYNSQGKVQKKIEYDKDGNLYGTTIYEYDEGGNIIKEETYDADNELRSDYILTYDSAWKTAYTEVVSDPAGWLLDTQCALNASFAKKVESGYYFRELKNEEAVYQYTLFDINQDGMPELIINLHDYNMGFEDWFFCTYDEAKGVYLADAQALDFRMLLNIYDDSLIWYTYQAYQPEVDIAAITMTPTSIDSDTIYYGLPESAPETEEIEWHSTDDTDYILEFHY